MNAVSCGHSYDKTMAAQAEVTRVDGEQGQKFDLKAQVDADALARRISDATWQVWLI